MSSLLKSLSAKVSCQCVDVADLSTTPLTAATILVGQVTSSDRQALCNVDTAISVSHVAPLLPVDGQWLRAVYSGHTNQDLDAAGVFYLGDDLLAASNVALLERSLCASQTVLAAEAFSLGLKAGLDPHLLHSSISMAAGGSWSFRNLVPQMLNSEEKASSGRTEQSLEEAKSALSLALEVAAASRFYAPLTALSRQLYQLVPGSIVAERSSSAVFEVWRSSLNVSNGDVANGIALPSSTAPAGQVGFVGLGAMGYGMANVLRNAGINTIGFDVWAPSMAKYHSGGGSIASSLKECASQSDVFVLMVVSAAQAEGILFGEKAALDLPKDAVVLLMSTAAPSQVDALSQRLQSLRADVRLVDAPVSGGTSRAATGDLTILCAGLEYAGPGASKALGVLQALSGSLGHTENLVMVPGGPGKGAAVKLINQHLAGCHISSTMETLAFARRLELPLRQVRALLLEGPAASWMMGHRGKHMLDGLLRPPTSMISIFVKDMGIVVNEALQLESPVPLASLVEQQFILGYANGWSNDDDSSLIRLWRSSGIDVTCPP